MSGHYVSLVLASGLVPDLKFTAVVLASYADDQGYRIWPSIGDVAHLRGLAMRRVQDHVKELRRMEILTVVRPATQWRPPHYRMHSDKLPYRAPYRAPDRQRYLLDGGESPPGKNSGVQSTAPLPGVQPTTAGVQPTAPDPSQDPPPRTHTADAREADINSEVQPAAPLDFRLEVDPRLPMIVAPTRDPDHAAHAWCGRICVPKFLHKELKRALGGPLTKRAGRMRAFYAETLAAIPSARPIGEEPPKFWRAAFAARFSTHQKAQPSKAGSAVATDLYDLGEQQRRARGAQ